MLTEDNPSVAEATGKMIGLPTGKAVTGKQISDSVKYGTELDLKSDIFARITPEQKLYIIDKLKKSGEVVAMTGTRTTDADALDLADIGITMSQHTAGSAYEAADIIMNDDNFSSIADMISSARQIHRNIKRAVSVMISGYIALLVLNALNIFGNAQLMLNPAILALVTMIVLPLSALGYLCCKSDMKSNMPPSEFVTSRKINPRFIGESAIIGLLSGAVAIASYMFMYNGSNVDFARSCSLISLCICTAVFGFLRISAENPLHAAASSGKMMIISLAVTALLPIILVYLPFINSAFGLVEIDLLAMFISVVTGILPGILYFFVRRIIKGEHNEKNH
jgi:Ca2+-transporting ATPase